MIGFANVVAAQLYGDGMNFVLVCAIVGVLALAIGAFNGALSSTLGVHPLIVTLGVGTAVQGAVLLWTAGFPAGSAPEAVTKFVSIGGHAGPSSGPVAHSVFSRPFGFHDAGAGENAVRAAALRGWQQSAGRALRAHLAACDLDGDLRPERPVRRHGWRAAAGVYRLGLRRRRATLSCFRRSPPW